MKLNATVEAVTAAIRQRSQLTRSAYLERLALAAQRKPGAERLGCANVAHAFAALPANDKLRVVAERAPNIGIVTAYNDMLSAHAPFQDYPALIRMEARRLGATAQVAGGVPAMCDGVTQGTPGMELSLFSRDVIAMATAVSLSHDVFDAVLMLGVCDKIVPGLLIGALHFGHLPTVFVPAGPMTSGLSNNEKSRVREQAAQGLLGRPELLAAESAAYHGAGTCTFYGTANSNQMLLEAMGLHVPGTAFINPGAELRDELTREAVRTVLRGQRLIAAGPPQGDQAPMGGSAAHEMASVGVHKLGCFNLHASILPRWRGAAPIQRAIEAGDAETGVTIMQMDAGLDTGDMLLAHTTEILASDTTGSLQDRLAVLGARLMLLALEVASVNALKPIAQQAEGVTYAHKIDKAEAAIDWAQDAAQIARRVRAFNPAPGASAMLQGETLKIWRAEALAHPAPAGIEAGSIVAVSAEGIVVAALDSMLLITELQRPGAKRLSVADFMRGFELRAGMAFEKSPR